MGRGKKGRKPCTERNAKHTSNNERPRLVDAQAQVLWALTALTNLQKQAGFCIFHSQTGHEILLGHFQPV